MSSCSEDQYQSIEVALNVVNRRLLGVEAETATDTVRHELGVASVQARADAAVLKFRNTIKSLDTADFLVRRVYEGLVLEAGLGSGSSRNGALYLKRLASAAKWPGPLTKGAAKKLVGEILATLQSAEFNHGVARLSTLRNMSDWVDEDRFGLPEYLKRPCPCTLREGRRLKTKFRVGCHPLRSSAARMERVRNATCPCCDTNDSETIQHTLFECKLPPTNAMHFWPDYILFAPTHDI